MCTLCAAVRPLDPLNTADQHLTLAEREAALNGGISSVGTVQTSGSQINAPFTIDQIALQLTDGYWNSNFEAPRAFDLGADRTLTYDMSGLEDPDVQRLVVQAFEAWTDVSGIRFEQVAARTVRTESGDAAETTNTTAAMNVGQAFNGTLSTTDDIDFVRISLTAGQTYTFRMDARGGSFVDPFLFLLDNNGDVLRSNDDTNGTGSQITFTANRTGTYFLDAESYNFESSGDYQLTASAGTGSRGADITFDDEDSGAYSTSEVNGNNTILSSFVNLQPNWDSDPISMNSYWFQTMVHEIGHALGLGHSGNYNGSAEWGVDNDYDNDSWQASIMSYFAQGELPGGTPFSVNPNIGASYAYLATLMPADIIAIQNMYGSNFSTRASNTTYGANSNVTGALGQLMDQAFDNAASARAIFIDNPVALTIYDTGGRDTLDFSTFGVAQRINLNAGTFSNVAGLRENLQIARGVVIEDAKGGRGADTLVGNIASNTLYGNAGADTLQGGDGNDTLIGGSGRDRLEGGTGADMASYMQSSTAVLVDLENAGANTGEAAGDVLISVTGVRGGRFGDRLFGDGFGNRLQGLDGHDVLTGRAGNDALDGGNGIDKLSGGLGNDTLRGDAGADQLIFNSGRDVIVDFANNIDTLVLSRTLWGGANFSVARILQDFAFDVGTAVDLRFSPNHSIRLMGVGTINALIDDISFI
ncbi:MAG: M10 family metallopeptidase C-terminal domain-containing protein [Paracoccaceae bacterium]